MSYLGGEGGSRDLIYIHGGRKQGPELTPTHGCIRILDEDIVNLKKVTDQLTEEDPDDTPEDVTVVDDLEVHTDLSDREDILINGSILLDEIVCVATCIDNKPKPNY